MRQFIDEILRGEGTRARSLRSSAFMIAGFAAQNVLRLASNLILTRLLFPEVFGLMALVQVFMAGLTLFSDIGLNISIIQNRRGADQDFLDTTWTLQILRGVLLWGATCALALPAAAIYGEPQLAQLLPAVGLTAVIQGFTTTRVWVANRNLQIGAQVSAELAGQVVGLAVMVALAWATESVWALVVGGWCTMLARVVLMSRLLKGTPNRWLLDRGIAWELVGFGKYIFLASVAGFFVNQSDRAILGANVPIEALGVFTVAFIFASFPLDLARIAGGKIILPIFSRFPPRESLENRTRSLRARRLVLGCTVALSGLLSLIAVPLVDTLYDPRYHDAGAILVLLGFSVTTQIAVSNYDGVYLGAGDSRTHFLLIAVDAAVQVSVALLLISSFGVVGAALSMATTLIITYPVRAWVVARYRAWDPLFDLLVAAFGWSCAFGATMLYSEELAALMAAG